MKQAFCLVLAVILQFIFSKNVIANSCFENQESYSHVLLELVMKNENASTGLSLNHSTALSTALEVTKKFPCSIAIRYVNDLSLFYQFAISPDGFDFPLEYSSVLYRELALEFATQAVKRGCYGDARTFINKLKYSYASQSMSFLHKQRLFQTEEDRINSVQMCHDWDSARFLDQSAIDTEILRFFPERFSDF